MNATARRTSILRLSLTVIVFALTLAPAQVVADHNRQHTINQGIQRDIDALNELYNVLDGNNWRRKGSWGTLALPKDWEGIETDTDGRVTEINLASNLLNGDISRAKKLGNIETLQKLNLNGNRITGQIPTEWRNWENLLVMNLAENQITGPIPSQWASENDNLETVNLCNNDFTGTIPKAYAQRDSLEILAICNNARLGGTIHKEFGSSQKLHTLTLNNNNLTGGIPKELGNAPSILSLRLHDNDLTGTIPAELTGLVDNVVTDFTFSSFYIRGNQLTGCVPFELAEFTDQHNLSPCLDDAQRMERAALVKFYDSTTATSSWTRTDWWKSDPYPVKIWFGVTADEGRVTELSLPNNNLRGNLAPELGQLERLQVLDLNGNRLTGSIPAEWGELGDSLRTLDLRNNPDLTGCVPRELGNVMNLQTDSLQLCANISALEAIYDALGGEGWAQSLNWKTDAPPGDWHGVTVNQVGVITGLDLDNNNLVGDMPSAIGELPSLTSLKLGNNRISGVIPASAVSHEGLLEIDLRSNQLIGPIPDALTRLPSLQKLFLNSNRLSGPIPSGLSDLADTLTHVHLSANSGLTGCIPGELVKVANIDFTDPTSAPVCAGSGRDRLALIRLYDDTNGDNWSLGNNHQWKTAANLNNWAGVTANSEDRVTELELNGKNLSGTLPTALGDLSELRGLTVVNNSGLTGNIPPQLGGLARLDNLYLSNNGLTGLIPRTLGNIATLNNLSLGGNDLAGAIPVELGNLGELNYLNLVDNELTGHIPQELDNLADSLNRLLLAGNDGLTGCLPHNLGGVARNDFGSPSVPDLCESPRDIAVLEVMYRELRDAGNWTDETNWNSSADARLWFGVTVDGLGRIAKLELTNNNLAGQIPHELIGVVDTLATLKLAGNTGLTGCIPVALKDVTDNDLATLSLPDCGPEDLPPVVTLELSEKSIAENGGVTTVTATLNRAATEVVSLSISATPQAPATAGDYSLSANTELSFVPGQTMSVGTVTITAQDNNQDSPDKVIQVSAVLARGTATIPPGKPLTITNDEAAPVVTLTSTPAVIPEGDTVAISATLSHPSSADTVVTLQEQDRYTPGADNSLIIPAGQTSSASDTASLTTNDNSYFDNPDQKFTILVAVTNAYRAATPTVRGEFEFQDDEGPPQTTLDFTRNPLLEGFATMVTATRTHDSQASLFLDVALRGEGATLAPMNRLSFATGSLVSQGTVWVAAPEDNVFTGNRTLTVSAVASGLGAGRNGESNPPDVALTVVDNETGPTVTLNLTPERIEESGIPSIATVTAELDETLEWPVEVRVSAEIPPGANGSEDDFTLSRNRILVIETGQTESTGTVTIAAVDNGTDAPSLSVTVSGEVTRGRLDDPASQTLRIQDDEDSPTVTLTVAPNAIAENGGTATVKGRLNHRSTADTTVTVRSVAGLYTVGASANQFTIPAGSLDSGDDGVTITAVDNSDDDGNRQGNVKADPSNLNGVMSKAEEVRLTIIDDEGIAVPVASLQLNPAGPVSEADGPVTVTATLSAPASEQVSLTVSAAAGDGANQGDFTFTGNKVLTIAAGKTESTGTVTVGMVNDSIYSRTRSVVLSANAAGGGVAHPSPVSFTILEDEPLPTVTLTLADPAIAENGGTTSLTATMSPRSRYDTQVAVEAVPGLYRLPKPAILTIPGQTSNSEQPLIVTAVDDQIDNGTGRSAEMTGIALSSRGTPYTLKPVMLTVTDNEPTPTLVLNLDSKSIPENGGVATVTASLEPNGSSEDVTVTVAAEAGSGTTSDDFSVSQNVTLTIPAGETTSAGEVTITASDNSKFELAKMVSVSGMIVGESDIADPSPVTLTIAEDEPAPVVSLGLSPNAIHETGARRVSTVSARLSQAAPVAVTITVEAAAGQGTTDDDFTLSQNRQLIIAQGQTTSTGTVTITAQDNDVDAPDKMITVSGKITGEVLDPPANRTLTIFDNEFSPTVVLKLASDAISEKDGTTKVTARMSGPSSQATSVTVTTDGELYTVGSPATMTIPAGKTLSDGDGVTLTAVDDSEDNPTNRSGSVTATASNSHGVVATAIPAQLTLFDDEGAPTAILVLTPAMIAENAGSTTVTATLTGMATEDVMLTVSAKADSGTAEGDFTVSANRTLTIPKGQTASTGAVTVEAVDNNVFAPDKTVTISASAAGGNVTAPTNVVLTLQEDDAVPTATLVLTPATVSENGGVSTVTATLSHPQSTAMSLTVSALSTMPENAPGYVLSASPILDIPALATASSGTVTVTAVDDNVDDSEDMKVITVAATVTGRSRVADPDDVSLTITDDEVAPTVTLELEDSIIPEDGGTTMVRARMNHVSSEDTVVTVTENTGLYTVGMPATMTIPAGDTVSSGTGVTIAAVDDEEDNPINRTGDVTATTSNDYRIVETAVPAALSLVDNEGAPTVMLLLSPAILDEDANATKVTARLSGAAPEEVTVTVAAVAGDGTTDQDFALGANHVLTIPKDETESVGEVLIFASDDEVYAPNRLVTVTATAVGGGVADPMPVTLTIREDEPPPTVTLVLTPATIMEDGSTATVTATLDAASSVATTVTVSASPEAPATASDFRFSSNRILVIPPLQAESTGQVTITSVDNAVGTPDRTVTVSARVEGGHGVRNPAPVTLTIADNDRPAFAIDSPSIAEGDTGTQDLVFTVSLTPESPTAASVNYAIDAEGGTATSGEDYEELAPGTLVFNAGEVSMTVTVQVNGDNLVEGDETVLLTLSAATNSRIAVGTGTGTITDDDDRGLVFSQNAISVPENGSSQIYTVQLASQPTGPVTVTPTSASTAITIEPQSLTFTAEDWNTSQPIFVTGVDDSAIGNRTAVIHHEVTGADYAELSPVPSVRVTVVSEDLPSIGGTLTNLPPGLIYSFTRMTRTPASTNTVTFPDGIPAYDIVVQAPSGEIVSSVSTDVQVCLVVNNVAQTAMADDDLGARLALFHLPEGERRWVRVPGSRQTPDELQVCGTSRTFSPYAIGLTAMPESHEIAMILAGIGEGIATDAVAAIEGRFREMSTGNGRLTLAGHTLPLTGTFGRNSGSGQNTDPDPWFLAAGTALDGATERRPTQAWQVEPWREGEHSFLSAREILTRSAFQIPLGPDGGQGNATWTAWGRGAATGFRQSPEPGFSMDGSVDNLYLGVDHRFDSDLLLGFAVGSSAGVVDYQSSGNEVDTAVALTTLLPYAHWRPRPGLEFWSILGAASGELEIFPESGLLPTLDLQTTFGAMGVRQELTRVGGFEIAAKSDALVVQTRSESTFDLAEAEGDAGYFRLQLESRGVKNFQSGDQLTPHVSLGLRLGEDLEGLGTEVQGGFTYVLAGVGMRVEAQGRYLQASEQDGFEEWGASLDLRVDPGTAGDGVALSVAPVWGPAASNSSDGLWQGAHPTDRRNHTSRPGYAGWTPRQLEVELEYGIGLARQPGKLTPYSGVTLSESGASSYRIGGRLALESSHSLSVESARHREADESVSQEIAVDLDWRW